MATSAHVSKKHFLKKEIRDFFFFLTISSDKQWRDQRKGAYMSVSMAWSLVTWEKWVSRMVTVPVRATWPHPQNRATPEKQRMVATSEAYGTPPKHLMQHSKQPAQETRGKLSGF